MTMVTLIRAFAYPQTSEWGFSDFSVSKAESPLFSKVMTSLCRGGGVHPLMPRTVKSADAALGIPKIFSSFGDSLMAQKPSTVVVLMMDCEIRTLDLLITCCVTP
jgi:hypothetical protein